MRRVVDVEDDPFDDDPRPPWHRCEDSEEIVPPAVNGVGPGTEPARLLVLRQAPVSGVNVPLLGV